MNNWVNTASDSNSFTYNEWAHVATTYDAQTKTLVIYKNGIEVAKTTGVPVSRTNLVQMGAYHNSNNFTGEMKDVRLWNTALSQDELASLKDGAKVNLNDARLVGFWNYIDGNKMIDISANGNHGEIVGKIEGPNTSSYVQETIINPTRPQEGDGTAANPYIIMDAHELAYMTVDTYRSYKLGANIDLTGFTHEDGKGWKPIGNPHTPFRGTFDGNNFVISGLTIDRPNESYLGLFARVSHGAKVKNVRLFDVDVTGQHYVGAIFGYGHGFTIENAWVTGNITGQNYVGGLVGYVQEYSSNLINLSVVEMNVKAKHYAGSFVGAFSGNSRRGTFTINESYSTGTAYGYQVGGIIGTARGTNLQVTNSYSTANVSGSAYVGGLVGDAYSHNGTFNNTYYAGELNAETSAGHSVGGLNAFGGNPFIDSYWDTEISGQTRSAGTSADAGKTTAEMQDPATYAKWDPTVWNIEAGKYPTLKNINYTINDGTDSEPPVTTVEVPEAPASGWYDGDVTLNFAVSENATTEYRINGGEWVTFTEPVVLGEGNFEVEYRSVDSNGNAEEAKSMSFNIDYTAPTTTPEVTSTMNENGWYTEDVAITLNAVDNVTQAEKIEYRTNGGEWKVYDGPFTLPEGVYSLEYRSVDAAGNVSAIETKTFNIDTTAPTSNVEMSGTANANGWFTSDVGITLVAEDAVSGANKTEYSLDGVNWTTYTGPFTLEDGVYHLQYRSYDAAGFVEAVQTMDINIDQTAPVSEATVAQQANENGWYTDVATLVLASDDNVSGSAVTEYRINGGEWVTYTEAITLADGVWSVEYRTTDKAGNVEVAKSIDFSVDTTAAVTEVSEMTGTHGMNGWYVSDATFALTATDNVSDTATTEYRINGGAWVTYTDAVTLTDGIYTVEYRTIDVAGNVEETKAMTINVDTTAPELAVALDQDNLWSPNHKMVDINAMLTYSDTTSDIASVELVSITSNEPDSVNKGDKANDIQGVDYGTEDTAFQLRAERLGKGEGRIYTITYKVIDVAGNETTVTTYVEVPHDKGNKGNKGKYRQ